MSPRRRAPNHLLLYVKARVFISHLHISFLAYFISLGAVYTGMSAHDHVSHSNLAIQSEYSTPSCLDPFGNIVPFTACEFTPRVMLQAHILQQAASDVAASQRATHPPESVHSPESRWLILNGVEWLTQGRCTAL